MTKIFKPKYSGKKSAKFWKSVNSFLPEYQRELYSLGVALQNLEHQVLKALNEANRK